MFSARVDHMKNDPETRPLLARSTVDLSAAMQKPVKVSTTKTPTSRQSLPSPFVIGVSVLILTGGLVLPSMIRYIVLGRQANHAAPGKLDSDEFVGGELGQSSLQAERRRSINLDGFGERNGPSGAGLARHAVGDPHNVQHGIRGGEGDSTDVEGRASQTRGHEGRDYVRSGEVDVVNDESTGGDGETTVVTPREHLIKRQDLTGKYKLPPNVPREYTESPASAVKGRARGSGEEMSNKPNVFFIMIDDMGWGDMGYQSTDLSRLTPNLDRLAAGGIKLTNYYSMHKCTPARASLMTGRYPVRHGMQYEVISAGAMWGLPLYEKILPQYMNDAGYESHMVGKWHIGSFQDASTPFARGFDTFLGYLNGQERYWSHKNLEAVAEDHLFYDFGFGNQTAYYDVTNDLSFLDWTSPAVEGAEIKEGIVKRKKFVTDDIDTSGGIVDEALVDYVGVYSEDAFIGRATRIVQSKTPWDGEPLFLFLAHQSVHSPLTTPPLAGFSKEERALLTSIDSTSEERQEFAAALLYLDKKIGIFLDVLESGGWLENSIVVVASDNGGCPGSGGSNYPLRGTKSSYFEGGTKVPAFIYSRSHIPHELSGTTYDAMMHVTDWVPTLASAVGGKVRGSAGPLDGIDHWSHLTSLTSSKAEGPRTELLYNWDPYELSSNYGLRRNDALVRGAFRRGKWKIIMNGFCSGYISFDPSIQDPLLDPRVLCANGLSFCNDCTTSCASNTEYKFANWLFNLEDDPRETTNLIEEYPEIARELLGRAREVALSEYTDSLYQEVNEDSYGVWIHNNWWQIPFLEELSTLQGTTSDQGNAPLGRAIGRGVQL